MAKPVRMDVPRVKIIAMKFETFATILKAVDVALDGLAATLKGIAFCGLVGVRAEQVRIRRMQEEIRRLQQKSLEIQAFVEQEIAQFEEAQQSG